MSQLTKQDVAEVVETVMERTLDKKLDEKFEQKLGLKPGETLDDKLEQKLGLKSGETLNDKLGLEPGETLNDKLERQTGVLSEHFDDKFDSLAEAIQVVNSAVSSATKQSDLREIRYDIKTIKVAVRATNDDLWRQSK